MQGPVRWQMVRDEALRRIRSHEWPAGERIPDEVDLASELHCARATVNRALQDLADAGYLERRRRGGTRVPLNPVRKATFSIAILRQDIQERGQKPGYRLLSDNLQPTPDSVKALLGPNAPETMRHVTAVHLADDTPFCLEDRWLNPAALMPDISFDTMSANEWLVQNLGYAAGTFSFQAVRADAALATHLDCATGSALLTLERTTSDALPITAVRLIYAPGHRIDSAL